MKTTQRTLELYRRLRADPVSMLVGRCAEMALRDARTIAEFESLEARGLVRMNSEPEEENYFDVFGREGSERDQKRLEETLERMGVYYVSAQYFDGEDWQNADGVGMCVYDDPESPFENCYVSQMMAEAITKANALLREPAERAYWEARDVATI